MGPVKKLSIFAISKINYCDLSYFSLTECRPPLVFANDVHLCDFDGKLVTARRTTAHGDTGENFHKEQYL